MDPLIAAQVGKSIADIFSGAKSGKPVNMTNFKEAMNQIRDLYENYQDSKNLHLSNYIKKSMVSSRVFIQRACAEEPILNDLLGSIQQLYLSWILTAIDMNKYVDGTRTIRNMLDVVATEAMEYNLPMQDDDALISGLASYNGYQPKFVAFNIPFIGKDKDKDEDDEDKNKNKKTSILGNTTIVDTTPIELNLSYGRLVEVIFSDNNKVKTSIKLFVQILPLIIPDNVMKEFLMLNYKPDNKQRRFQLSAGEISFWRDYLFELDLSERKRKALRDDKTGYLKEMYNELNKNQRQKLKKYSQLSPNKQNVANTIHVYDKASFNRWCGEVRMDFRNPAHREKYFNDTLSMIVATIDSDYEKIDMYFAGIQNRAEFNFNQVKKNSKDNNYDLTSIMKAFSSASAPRF